MRLNVAAIGSTIKAIFNPQILVPHIEVRDIRQIKWEVLKSRGYTGIIFDKDNTLTIPHDDKLCTQFVSSFEACKEVFGKDRVAIFSNSLGNLQKQKRVSAKVARAHDTATRRFEEEYGICILVHEEDKPAGYESVERHFQSPPQQLVVVGDRYTTDVLFANLNGMLSIRTDQFTEEGESVLQRWVQPLEAGVVRMLMRNGVQPPRHAHIVTTNEVSE